MTDLCVKIPISKDRYVKVVKFRKKKLEDGIMFSHGVIFVRWSRKHSRLLLTKIMYSDEAINALGIGLSEIKNIEKQGD